MRKTANASKSMTASFYFYRRLAAPPPLLQSSFITHRALIVFTLPYFFVFLQFLTLDSQQLLGRDLEQRQDHTSHASNDRIMSVEDIGGERKGSARYSHSSYIIS